MSEVYLSDVADATLHWCYATWRKIAWYAAAIAVLSYITYIGWLDVINKLIDAAVFLAPIIAILTVATFIGGYILVYSLVWITEKCRTIKVAQCSMVNRNK
jgi:hypothetical protein